jgi:alkylation response protein AidB-like acyl-CoA dehydrogenase
MGHGKALSEKSVETTQIYEGTNQIQRVVIAKHLLG